MKVIHENHHKERGDGRAWGGDPSKHEADEVML